MAIYIKEINMAKYVTTAEALALVQSGDYIVTGLGSAEARDFMTNLHTIADRVKGVIVSNCLPMGNYEFMVNPAYKNSFTTESWFYTPALRKAQPNGNVSFIPNHLHLAATKRIFYRTPDVYVGIASMPDKHGYVSLSLSNTYEMKMIKSAKTI